MTILKVYNLGNQETGTVDLHDSIAESKLNPFVIKDVVVSYMSERQQGTHKVKGRSEVAGTRKKLFRQKGTGNARVGSLQSPTRRHGGVAFGPVPRSHAVAVNKKVRKKALVSVIGSKIRNEEMLVVEDLKLQDHKTKNLVTILEALNLEKTLVVFSEEDPNFALAARNIPTIKCVHSKGLSVYDVLNHKNLVMTKDALLDVEGRMLK
ncbi:MAG: 50S ribosomal protein L4 [Deltaproteobacteria bacterium]|nr:50S ribosomal protein L4 [Deltaproteobacteria bacterium]